jgi:hypothetical protein
MLNGSTVKPTSVATSPVKPTHMEVEVVLKSPSPAKSKVRVVNSDTPVALILQQGKEPVVAKVLKSKPRRAPTADHDSDNEVTKEPQRKRKARETVRILIMPFALLILLCFIVRLDKPQQSTAARAQPSHEQIADEEQEQERPKRIRPKMVHTTLLYIIECLQFR